MSGDGSDKVTVDSLNSAKKLWFYGQRQLCLIMVMLSIITQSSDGYSKVGRIGTLRKRLKI